MTKAWKHEREEINQFQLCDDDDAQSTHYVLVYVEGR